MRVPVLYEFSAPARNELGHITEIKRRKYLGFLNYYQSFYLKFSRDEYRQGIIILMTSNFTVATVSRKFPLLSEFYTQHELIFE